jgi:hypothetical protein
MAFTFVNSASGTNGLVEGTSYTLAYTPDAGNGVFIIVGYLNGGGSPVTVAIASFANQNGTNIPFVLGDQVDASEFNYGQGLAWVPALPSGTTSITVTMAATCSGGIGMAIIEFSGLSSTLSVDVQGASSLIAAPSTDTDALVSPTVTPTGAADGAIVFGFAGSYSGFEAAGIGTGFTGATETIVSEGVYEYKRITSNASVAATWTANVSGHIYSPVVMVVDEPAASIDVCVSWFGL